MTRCLVPIAILCSALAASAQDKLTFEVASIRPSVPGAQYDARANPGEFLLNNVTLGRLVRIAYHVRDYAYSGPDWMETLHFDLRAKMPAGAKGEQRSEMLQTLLAERFKLVVHRERKLVPGYTLVTAKSGFKLKPVEAAAMSGESAAGRLVAQAFTMDELAQLLERELNQPVVDKTGIPGRFTFTLEFSEESLKPIAPDKPPDDSRPSIFSALQAVVGLNLVPEKTPVEIVIVDHIERAPTEN